jgi:hypothetical protein
MRVHVIGPSDDEARSDAVPAGTRRGVGPAWVLALLGPLAVWAAAVAVASSLAPTTVAEGQCEGIGFGCTLSPADGILFIGVYIGLFAVPIATVVLVVIAACSRQRPLATVGSALAVFASVVSVLAMMVAATPPNT